MQNLLLKDSKLLLTGAPKQRKSMLALQLIFSVAAGVPFLDRFSVPRPLRAVYFQYEITVRSLKTRIELMWPKFGSCVYEPAFMTKPPSDIPLLTLVQKVEERYGKRPELVVFDPLTYLHNYDENNAQAMKLLTDQFDEIIDYAECGLVIVHHNRKQSGLQGGGSKGLEQARGSIQISAWPNTVVTMNPKGQNMKELLFDLRDSEELEPLLLSPDPNNLTFSPVVGRQALTKEFLASFIADHPGWGRAAVVKVLAQETGWADKTIYRKLAEYGFDSFF